jgi:hypothetical protein
MNLLSNVSLRAKFLLATFASIAALFLLTGLVIEYRTVRTASRSLEKEALASLEAYESLWRLARARGCAGVSESGPQRHVGRQGGIRDGR